MISLETLREKFIAATATALVTVALSGVASWVAITRAQANHEDRITRNESAVRDNRSEQQRLVSESEGRIRADLTEIKSSVEELRKAQMRSLERMADMNR